MILATDEGVAGPSGEEALTASRSSFLLLAVLSVLGAIIAAFTASEVGREVTDNVASGEFGTSSVEELKASSTEPSAEYIGSNLDCRFFTAATSNVPFGVCWLASGVLKVSVLTVLPFNAGAVPVVAVFAGVVGATNPAAAAAPSVEESCCTGSSSVCDRITGLALDNSFEIFELPAVLAPGWAVVFRMFIRLEFLFTGSAGCRGGCKASH